MKTKEIECWINKDELKEFLEEKDFYASINRTQDSDEDIKLTIKIHQPEKKVRITEAELYEAFEFSFGEKYLGNYKQIRNKLFGEKS